METKHREETTSFFSVEQVRNGVVEGCNCDFYEMWLEQRNATSPNKPDSGFFYSDAQALESPRAGWQLTSPQAQTPRDEWAL